MRFACTRMVHSYKPVLTGILLDRLPALRVPLREVQDKFVAFYQERERAGLPVERRGARIQRNGIVEFATARAVAADILRHVFRSRGYVSVTDGWVALCSVCSWRAFAEEPPRSVARKVLRAALSKFYERIELLGEAVYGQANRDHAADPDEVVLLLPGPDDPDELFIL